MTPFDQQYSLQQNQFVDQKIEERESLRHSTHRSQRSERHKEQEAQEHQEMEAYY
jgi:hypothetical protein